MNNKLAHVAIIMDGNGRWAKTKNKMRIEGHKEGLKRVEEITIECSKMGIDYLTMYAFSTENWYRPKAEVMFLISLLDIYLTKKEHIFLNNNIRFKTIGDITKFSPNIQKKVKNLELKTSNNTAMTQVIAINYGSRNQIIKASNLACKLGISLNKNNFKDFLDTKGMPYVDLFIRTGGEIRISNFLLWEIAYAELFFSPILWPDFTKNNFREIVSNFNKRDRRFGKVK